MISPGFHIILFLQVAMDFIEYIRICLERAKAGFGAEQDHPASIFGAWIIVGVGVAKDPPAEGDEFSCLGSLIPDFD